MKDEDWDYRIQLSGSTGTGATAARFEQLAYTNTLLVAFQEIIDLDLRRFGKGDLGPKAADYRYDRATITYQPTGETVAATRHHAVGGPYFPTGPGLYLELTPPLASVEQTLGISLAPLRSKQLPEGHLRLASYAQDHPRDLVTHDGVDQVSDLMMEKRWKEDYGIFQLEIHKPAAQLVAGAATTYHFDLLKDGLLALLDRDLADLNPVVGKRFGPAVSTMVLSHFGEPLIEVERHPRFLAFPVTGVPGIYYTVPHKDSLNMLSREVDLSVLPHFELAKDYFQVAAYQDNTHQPTPIAALSQLRSQLEPTAAPTLSQASGRYVLEFEYHVAVEGATRTGRAHFDQLARALQTLCALEPTAFDLEGATAASPRLQRAQLLNQTSGELMATMFKAKEGDNGLPGGIYLMIGKEHLTPALSSAIGPNLSEHEHGGHYHFLLAKAGELATLQRKHSDRPRTIVHNDKDTGLRR
ncbi:hypothetical protein [Chitinophaga parva]|nr:hypothetical protein [Chitinophaga parva]